MRLCRISPILRTPYLARIRRKTEFDDANRMAARLALPHTNLVQIPDEVKYVFFPGSCNSK